MFPKAPLFFWLCRTACGFLVPRPGIKPMPPALEARWKCGILTTEPSGKSLKRHLAHNLSKTEPANHPSSPQLASPPVLSTHWITPLSTHLLITRCYPFTPNLPKGTRFCSSHPLSLSQTHLHLSYPTASTLGHHPFAPTCRLMSQPRLSSLSNPLSLLLSESFLQTLPVVSLQHFPLPFRILFPDPTPCAVIIANSNPQHSSTL